MRNPLGWFGSFLLNFVWAKLSALLGWQKVVREKERRAEERGAAVAAEELRSIRANEIDSRTAIPTIDEMNEVTGRKP